MRRFTHVQVYLKGRNLEVELLPGCPAQRLYPHTHPWQCRSSDSQTFALHQARRVTDSPHGPAPCPWLQRALQGNCQAHYGLSWRFSYCECSTSFFSDPSVAFSVACVPVCPSLSVGSCVVWCARRETFGCVFQIVFPVCIPWIIIVTVFWPHRVLGVWSFSSN